MNNQDIEISKLNIYNDIKNILNSARGKASKAINFAIVEAY